MRVVLACITKLHFGTGAANTFANAVLYEKSNFKCSLRSTRPHSEVLNFAMIIQTTPAQPRRPILRTAVILVMFAFVSIVFSERHTLLCQIVLRLPESRLDQLSIQGVDITQTEDLNWLVQFYVSRGGTTAFSDQIEDLLRRADASQAGAAFVHSLRLIPKNQSQQKAVLYILLACLPKTAFECRRELLTRMETSDFTERVQIATVFRSMVVSGNAEVVDEARAPLKKLLEEAISSDYRTAAEILRILPIFEYGDSQFLDLFMVAARSSGELSTLALFCIAKLKPEDNTVASELQSLFWANKWTSWDRRIAFSIICKILCGVERKLDFCFRVYIKSKSGSLKDLAVNSVVDLHESAPLEVGMAVRQNEEILGPQFVTDFKACLSNADDQDQDEVPRDSDQPSQCVENE